MRALEPAARGSVVVHETHTPVVSAEHLERGLDHPLMRLGAPGGDQHVVGMFGVLAEDACHSRPTVVVRQRSPGRREVFGQLDVLFREDLSIALGQDLLGGLHRATAAHWLVVPLVHVAVAVPGDEAQVVRLLVDDRQSVAPGVGDEFDVTERGHRVLPRATKYSADECRTSVSDCAR